MNVISLFDGISCGMVALEREYLLRDMLLSRLTKMQSQVWERLSHCSPQIGRGQASYRL